MRRSIEDEEGEDRVDRLVNAIRVEGPPWIETKSGRELKEELVDAGMKKEYESLKAFQVIVEVPEEEADKIISCKWVLEERI